MSYPKIDSDIPVFGEAISRFDDRNPNYQKSYRIRNPYRTRLSKYKHRYKVNADQLSYMDSKTSCEICGLSKDRMCVDHDHVTGKVRGKLCDDCNNGLGRFKDSLDLVKKAVHYLEVIAPANTLELEKLK